MSIQKVPDSMITGLSASKLTGTLPAVSGASLTALNAANVTGNLPAISGANLTNLTAGNLSCLLYTSPSPRDRQNSRMPSSG